jgi:hypothetical protein
MKQLEPAMNQLILIEPQLTNPKKDSNQLEPHRTNHKSTLAHHKITITTKIVSPSAIGSRKFSVFCSPDLSARCICSSSARASRCLLSRAPTLPRSEASMSLPPLPAVFIALFYFVDRFFLNYL